MAKKEPTAVPMSAATVAREKLLRAIAGEATALGKGKRKGRSSKALKTLSRAYALVAAEGVHHASGLPAAPRKSRGRTFLPSMRPVFLVKRAGGKKGTRDGGADG
ncbi:hypothetical protein CP973_26540 [Streptomyces albofaciens JCM 4342]|uniref:hypothetical protein n=1 Tax=Streptomyces albofaciens TaxID=66866 RepID=UPI00123A55B3|nr:hypothetical protein [Streptomyces albofaciens]KAA6212888.1 hypothetical protein CP973_26540 [Streptomyces albofaciens JCM 4342]